ncbi:MAG: right-handed parallel beta-helix repeat-containing protein [Candidatus Micrarchaeota archaeon]
MKINSIVFGVLIVLGFVVLSQVFSDQAVYSSTSVPAAPPRPSASLAPIPTSISPINVRCGQTITRNTVMQNDLLNCPNDGLIIGKDGITLDCNGHAIDGVLGDMSAGIRSVDRNYVTIKNCNITDFRTGIYAIDGRSINLFYNTLERNGGSYHRAAIFVSNISSAYLLQNSANYNQGGFAVYFSDNARLVNNTAKFNYQGNAAFELSGLDNAVIDQNIAESNSFGGFTLQPNYGGRPSANASFSRNVANKNDWGFYLPVEYNITVELNTASNNTEYGIFLFNSSYSKISGNIAEGNGKEGFYLNGKNLAIYGNSAKSNKDGFVLVLSDGEIYKNLAFSNINNGFSLTGGYYAWQWAPNNTVNNEVYENTANNNLKGFVINLDGFLSTSHNKLQNNFASDNKDAGFLIQSDNNSIQQNTAKNSEYGLVVVSLDGGSRVVRNNVLESNIVENASGLAIGLYRTTGTKILSNKVLVPTGPREGIVTYYSDLMEIRGNNILCEPTGYPFFAVGLVLNDSTNLQVWNNVITNCGKGLTLAGTLNSKISENKLASNLDEASTKGISLFASNSNFSTLNTIWNNTLMYNLNDSMNAYEAENIIGNSWDYNGVGNSWSDFSQNPGYPNTYVIPGLGDGVDHYPSGP